jgi:crossover junction endodeoxyribonuclease RusA
MNRAYLPWPPRILWPNARVHHMALYRAKKLYATECAFLCIQNKTRVMHDAERIAARITFFPPDRRRRDMDNMLAAIKAGIDQVAQHIGVDDSKWTMTLAVSPETRERGGVEILMEAVE